LAPLLKTRAIRPRIAFCEVTEESHGSRGCHARQKASSEYWGSAAAMLGFFRTSHHDEEFGGSR